MSFFTPHLAQIRHKTECFFAVRNKTPLFVLGNQKSGTTVIAALLAEIAGLSATLDFPWLTYKQTVSTFHGRNSLDTLIRKHRLEFSRDLIKEPQLTFFYSLLIERFPNTHYVFVIRDPRDNIRSILNRLRIPGHMEQIDLDKYGDVSEEWKLVLDGTWMGLQGENYIDLLAARWQRASSIYLSDQENFVLIRYEDFLDAKVDSIIDLAQQLHLPIRHDISDKIDVQYQPKGNRDVSWKDFFGPENLARINHRCSNQMKALGYAVS